MSYCHRGCLRGRYGYRHLLLLGARMGTDTWQHETCKTPLDSPFTASSLPDSNPFLPHPSHPLAPYPQSRLQCGLFDHISFKLLQSNCTITKQPCHTGWKHGRGRMGINNLGCSAVRSQHEAAFKEEIVTWCMALRADLILCCDSRLAKPY